jgi:hypothetical protein
MFARRATRWLVPFIGACFAVLAAAPVAGAWTWPANGAVLRPYSVGGDKYAAGQHRGVDVALDGAGTIRAPASGVVSFAGSLPTYGWTVTITTSDGHQATLTHLGRLGVVRGDAVREGAIVAAAGPSGDAEVSVPYVHLGVRTSADAYVDPLSLLPPRGASDPPPAPAAPPAASTSPAPAAPGATATPPAVQETAGTSGAASADPAGSRPVSSAPADPSAGTAAADPTATSGAAGGADGVSAGGIVIERTGAAASASPRARMRPVTLRSSAVPSDVPVSTGASAELEGVARPKPGFAGRARSGSEVSRSPARRHDDVDGAT